MCVLLQLQDWIPEYYENDELPTDMPEILKNEISSHNGPQEVYNVFLKYYFLYICEVYKFFFIIEGNK